MKFINKIRVFIRRNERYVSPAALFGGFILDSLTLQRIDLFFENFVLGSYLVLSGFLVFLISLIQRNRLKSRFFERSLPFLNLALLFVFGGLFSGFTVFYVRSSSLLSSWPFILLLIFVMVSTEYLKKHFSEIRLQILVFYFGLTTYLIFLVPIITKKIGFLVFVVSGIIGLVLIYFYISLFSKVYKREFVSDKNYLFKSIIVIFVTINGMYFLNIIPPIPLALKDSGIYQNIERRGDQYVVVDYKKSFIDYLSVPEKIKVKRGQPLYFFSSIFAPTKLNASVVHEWQFEKDGKWQTLGEIPFSITGGADRGFRGFSMKTSLEEGRWRVYIKLSNGQIIGKKSFKVEFVDNVPELIFKEK